jgi:hypothetical protein
MHLLVIPPPSTAMAFLLMLLIAGGDLSVPASEDGTPTARGTATSNHIDTADGTPHEMTALREPTLAGDGQGLMSAASAAAVIAASLPEGTVVELQTSDCRNGEGPELAASLQPHQQQQQPQGVESSSTGVKKGGGLSISLAAAAAPAPPGAGGPPTPGAPLSPGVLPSGPGPEGRSLVAASPTGAWVLVSWFPGGGQC